METKDRIYVNGTHLERAKVTYTYRVNDHQRRSTFIRHHSDKVVAAILTYVALQDYLEDALKNNDVIVDHIEYNLNE